LPVEVPGPETGVALFAKLAVPLSSGGSAREEGRGETSRGTISPETIALRRVPVV
jgi:hypothetical protein